MCLAQRGNGANYRYKIPEEDWPTCYQLEFLQRASWRRVSQQEQAGQFVWR